MLDALRHDLRYGLRQLRRSPGFTAVAVLTLAVGIGATTSVFSVVDQLLIRPLDYPHPERIVRLVGTEEGGGGRGTISAPDYRDWVAGSHVFQASALYDEYAPTLTVNGVPRKVPAASVGAAYFDVLGVRPAVGRFFRPEENEGGSSRVVLSWGLWRDAFGGDPSVVGRVVDLSGYPYTIVGVAPPMGDPGLSGAGEEAPRLWRSTPRYFEQVGRSGRSFTAIARLEPGVSVQRAREELRTVAARLARQHPDEDAGQSVRVTSLKDDLVGGVRPVLWILLAAVGLVLLITCANVANLLLFRASTRRREISVRSALGASRRRVVRQLMVESGLLALLGAAGGVLLALVATKGLVALAAGQLPRVAEVSVDGRVLLFAIATGSAAAVLSGLLPSVHASGVDLRDALTDGRGTARSERGGTLRTAGVAAQVALAVVIMLGAGVLGRSLLRLRAVDPGLAADRLLALRIDPPSDPYDVSTDEGETATLRLYDRLRRRLAALPGVDAVGMTDLLPMSGSFNGNAFRIVGRPEPAPGHLPSAEVRAVSPGYFGAAGIPLVRGQGFGSADEGRESPETTLLVNQAFVRRHFPSGGAVGARIRVFGRDAPPARIAGVVGDVTQFSLDRPADPVIYVPQARAPDYMQDEPWILLRTKGDPSALTAAAREAIHEVEPRTPVYGVRPMQAVVSATLARPRFRTVLLLAFAGIAFLLAAVGVYGMVAYAASRRLPELGVRVALGADPARLARDVVGRGLRPVLVGTGAGLLGGFAAVRLLSSLVYRVSPADPITFAAVPLTLLAVAAV
ncbi:MAG TPA: ABC transporter permease, partial [Gemmatimonadota bacterium]|nr:ABC transporter permease [Gemmatimonadota bacterium]